MSILGGRCVYHSGPGPVVALGSVAFGAGALIRLLRMDATLNYAASMLPGQLLTGLDIGLILPSLSGGWSARSCRRPAGAQARRSSTTARQVDTVLGTAVLIAVFAGTPGLAAFRRGWLMIVAIVAATGAGDLLIAARRRVDHYVEPQAAASTSP